MSAASHHLIVSTPLLYLTSKIVTPCWCTLVVSVLQEKCVKLCGNPEMSFIALQTLTSLLYFFLLEKSSWLFYIVMTLMMTMITYLLAVKGALLPACACMKGEMTVWPNGGCAEDNNDIRSVCPFHNVECFLSMRDSWIEWVCIFMCVCLLWNARLLQSQEQVGVNPTACFWQMCMKPLRAWLFGNCDI